MLIRRSLHDLAGESALQLIVETAAQEQEVPPGTQCLYLGRYRCLYVNLGEHFNDSRLEFYSAEALRAFSRDSLPPGAFDDLQDEVHGGIKDELRGEHADGYRCVMAVTKTARLLPISGHPLTDRLSVRDRAGICHQLANDKKVKWTS